MTPLPAGRQALASPKTGGELNSFLEIILSQESDSPPYLGGVGGGRNLIQTGVGTSSI